MKEYVKIEKNRNKINWSLIKVRKICYCDIFYFWVDIDLIVDLLCKNF